MKITNVNYSDEPSGSSIAVERINKMLKNENIDNIYSYLNLTFKVKKNINI